ncbi:MAG TPA: MFS transporter [Syntrophorhabdales bacterium]|nr:MFS transporter [Syntrophorhabdales bacterium]
MHYAWIIVIMGILGLMLAQGFGKMSYTVILPFMKDGLSLTYTQVGLIGTGNFIGYLLTSIVGGFLASRFGARKVIFLALLVTGVGLFLTGLSDSFSFAFVARLISGLGNGGVPVPVLTLPAIWFSVRKQGLAMGIVNMGVGLGLSLVGLLLPYCISYYGPTGWKYAWYLMGATVFVGSFVCYALLRDHPSEKGSTVYGGDGHHEQAGAQQNITLGSALRRVVVETEIWKLSCAYLTFGFSYMVYLTFFIAYLTKELGMETAEAGRIFALLGFLSIFCGLPWGGLSDRIGRRNASAFGYLTLAISFLLFAYYRQPLGVYLSAVIFGLTGFAMPVIVAAAVSDAVGGQLASAGFGFVTLFFGIGQALAPFVGGWIKDATGTFTNAFVLCAGVAILGAFSSYFLKRRLT